MSEDLGAQTKSPISIVIEKVLGFFNPESFDQWIATIKKDPIICLAALGLVLVPVAIILYLYQSHKNGDTKISVGTGVAGIVIFVVVVVYLTFFVSSISLSGRFHLIENLRNLEIRYVDGRGIGSISPSETHRIRPLYYITTRSSRNSRKWIIDFIYIDKKFRDLAIDLNFDGKDNYETCYISANEWGHLKKLQRIDFYLEDGVGVINYAIRDICKRNDSASGKQKSSTMFSSVLSGSALASVSDGPKKSLLERLNDDNRTVRVAAREELALEFETHQDWILDALTNKTARTSYRERLGALYALSKQKLDKDLPINIRNDLSSPDLLPALINLAKFDEPATRRLSRLVLVRNPTKKTIESLSEALAGASSGKERQRLSYAALLTNYNRAIGIIELFGRASEPSESSKKKIRTLMDESIQLLDDAFALREYAPKDEQIEYARALYGKGLVIHAYVFDKHRSLYSDLKMEPFNKERAVDAFEEFMSFVGEFPPQTYRYPHHICQARAYIKKPSIEAIQTNCH